MSHEGTNMEKPNRNDPVSALAIRAIVAKGYCTQEQANECFSLACDAMEAEAVRMNEELPWVTRNPPMSIGPEVLLHRLNCIDDALKLLVRSSSAVERTTDGEQEREAFEAWWTDCVKQQPFTLHAEAAWRAWQARAALKTNAAQAATDDELRALWRKAGGSFHGPIVEMGTISEAKLLPFLRGLVDTGRAEEANAKLRDALQGLIDFIEIDKLPMDEDAMRIANKALEFGV